MKVSHLIFIILLFCCCSSTSTVVHRVYEVNDPSVVMDSITRSGTVISNLTPFSYINDDSARVDIKIGSLYRNDRACGSIKIREENGIKVVSILDQIRKK